MIVAWPNHQYDAMAEWQGKRLQSALIPVRIRGASPHIAPQAKSGESVGLKNRRARLDTAGVHQRKTDGV